MSDSDKRSRLAEVVVKVFEQTAFMTPEIVDVETAREWPTTPCLLVSVEYHGPCEGIISLVIPPEPSQELTANFLGEDAVGGVLTREHIDAVKEVANIVVGQFLPEYYGSEAVFQLAPPEAELLDADQLEAKFAKEDFLRLDIDGEPLLATLTRGKDVHEHQSIGG